MTMDCKRFEKHLNAYVDGAVPPALQAAMQTHTASCPACRRKIEALTQIGDVLRAAVPLPPVPEGFANRVMARAAAEKPPVPLRLVPWLPSFEWWQEMTSPTRAAAAALLVTGIGLGAFMGWDTGRLQESSVGEIQTDSVVQYKLDFFEEAPAGSLAQVYLALAK